MPKSKATIIIVDDDEGVQQFFHLIFNQAGYRTIIYSDGEKILNNDFEIPDIFLLDKQLACSDGLDICRKLKGNAKTRNIPVIMVSGSPGIGKLAKEAGANDFLEKPFVTEELLLKVSAELGNLAPAALS
jgi:DNA-binding response OmpR family regulator